jgi:hypothetical protein
MMELLGLPVLDLYTAPQTKVVKHRILLIQRYTDNAILSMT